MLAAVASSVAECGIEVTRVDSGAELVRRLASPDADRYDLIVTDVSMPWMSGLQVARAAQQAGLQTPTLFITALKDHNIDVQIDALGKNALLLRKPFGLDQLIDAIHSLMSGLPKTGA